MQKLTVVLVLAVLGVAGWQAWEVSNLRDDLAQQQAEQEMLRADHARLTRTVHELEQREAQAAPLAREPAEHTAAEAGPAGGAEGEGPTLAARATSPTVMARALKDLEGKVEGLAQENEELRAKVGKRPQVAYKRPEMINDMDGAEKLLDLTSAQRADVERAVDWTKRELEDLYRIPNADGKLFSEIEKTKIDGGENFKIVMPNFAEIQKFKNSKVPGRTETYAQAERRIKDRGKKDVRDILTPEQQKTWDDSYNDRLFGGSSDAFSMVSISTSNTSTSKDD